MRLDDYCQHFAKLRRAPSRVFPEATRHKAPHKPLLLLAIMELIARGEIASRFISVTDELTELNALFTAYWQALIPIGQTSSIAFPFAHLVYGLLPVCKALCAWRQGQDCGRISGLLMKDLTLPASMKSARIVLIDFSACQLPSS